jgi:hypothetical protein
VARATQCRKSVGNPAEGKVVAVQKKSSRSDAERQDEARSTGAPIDNERANGATAGEPATIMTGSGPQDVGSGPAAIRVNGVDACDRPIDAVFFRRELYAIYRAQGRVHIQFAKNNDEADKQIDRVSALLNLRHQTEALARQLDASRNYDHQIANAMRMGLEGKAEIGQSLLEAACDRATAELKRRGRMQYLRSAGALAVTVAFALLLIGGGLLLASVDQLAPLSFSMAGGALGALLSIAIAIQKRTVAPAGDPRTNRVDGQLRVVIAVLSAGTLSLLASTGFIAGLSLATGDGPGAADTAPTASEVTWQVAILIGLAAGFVERLVPDLLDKASVTPAVRGQANGL